jgi:TRAP-type mannitol/chloroaromatic compound transport system permease small subunit
MWGAQILSILFVPLVVMGGGYVLREQEHVRMDVLYGRWSPRQCAIADAVTFIVFLVFTIMLAWMTIEMAWASVKIGEASWASFHGPIYPKKIALAAATVLLLLQGVAQFVRNLQLVRGENKRADK